MYRIRYPAGRSAILYILLSRQKRNAETRNYPFAQNGRLILIPHEVANGGISSSLSAHSTNVDRQPTRPGKAKAGTDSGWNNHLAYPT